MLYCRFRRDGLRRTAMPLRQLQLVFDFLGSGMPAGVFLGPLVAFPIASCAIMVWVAHATTSGTPHTGEWPASSGHLLLGLGRH